MKRLKWIFFTSCVTSFHLCLSASRISCCSWNISNSIRSRDQRSIPYIFLLFHLSEHVCSELFSFQSIKRKGRIDAGNLKMDKITSGKWPTKNSPYTDNNIPILALNGLHFLGNRNCLDSLTILLVFLIVHHYKKCLRAKNLLVHFARMAIDREYFVMLQIGIWSLIFDFMNTDNSLVRRCWPSTRESWSRSCSSWKISIIKRVIIFGGSATYLFSFPSSPKIRRGTISNFFTEEHWTISSLAAGWKGTITVIDRKLNTVPVPSWSKFTLFPPNFPL